MTAAATTSALGLTAAAIWGAADFSGGMAARHLRVFWLLSVSHAFSLMGLLLLAGLLHAPRPDGNVLAWGLCAGIAGGVALLTFYHVLSLGEMGTTASISGLLTAALPVVFTLLTIGAPSRRQLVGFVLAAGAIWMISSQPSANGSSRNNQRKKMVLAVASGLGFGTFFIAMREANSGGLLWPLAAARAGSLTLAIGGGLIFSRHRFTVEPAEKPPYPTLTIRWQTGVALALVAGTFDTSGNLFFIAATRAGRLDIAAVLSSLYPASTIFLAAWLLKEKTSPRQAVGMAAALAAVALIS